MKLMTSIKPRRDGAVEVRGLDGTHYTFKADQGGELVCDIDHGPTVNHLLAGHQFAPYDERDFGAALDTLKGGGGATGVVFTLRQAQRLAQLYEGVDAEVTVAPAGPGQDPGLYAWLTSYPEGGAQYLGPTEVQPYSAPQDVGGLSAQYSLKAQDDGTVAGSGLGEPAEGAAPVSAPAQATAESAAAPAPSAPAAPAERTSRKK